eukprot:CAMPEP_0184492936 /NCGR_PEP_ID=MMETSP0113_2-20130426/24640_1 /TAXON_ID=91329 /ORGANISM="Norrisiella sphaerica, Strain BC52" /LENGTH=474 /DNA_ID=CAMNT_0026877989 /DNA_START=35 /DNA_END=1456 /DNA_ORIENTATION=+
MGQAIGNDLKTKQLKELTQLHVDAAAMAGWDVRGIKLAFKKAQKSQRGLGYSLSKSLMREVIDISDEGYESLAKLWLEDKRDDACEFLNLMISALCVCKGSIYQKVSAIFSIYDEDDDKVLSRSQFKALGSVCIHGCKRLTVCPLNVKEIKGHLFQYLSHCVPKDRRGIIFEDVLSFACHPAVIPFLRAVSQGDGKTKAQKDMMIAKMIEMEEKASKQVLSPKMRVHYGNINGQTERKYSRNRVRKLKALFDALDTKEIGKVEFGSLMAHTHPQDNKDIPLSHEMSFNEFLGKVFPYSSLTERRIMRSWVYHKKIPKELVLKLHTVFCHLNVAFSGKVSLYRLFRVVKKSKLLREYVHSELVLELTEVEEEKQVTFEAFLERLFGESHHHQLAEMHKWADPTPALSDRQIEDLHAMFRKVDSDGSGQITLDEFKASLEHSGGRADAAQRFAELNKDDDPTIDALEFAHFYAQCW